MARGRMIDKRVNRSKKIASISDSAGFLWFMIYPNLDREGRIKFGDMEDLRDEILPRKKWKLIKITNVLNELAEIGLIELYPDSDEIAIQFNNFDRFQIGLHKDREAKSNVCPPPKSPEESGAYRINPENSSLNRSIRKEVKEGININTNTKSGKSDNKEFEDFWTAYPKKVAKQDALKAYLALRKSISLTDIASALNGYNAVIKREQKDPKYVMYPATFLRNEKWKDFLGIVYKPPL